jgi:hypothetical protein
MKTYGGVDVYTHVFLASAFAGGEWSVSRPGRFTPDERASGTDCIGGRVGPRAGLDNVEKRKFLTLPGLELRPLGSPARSQSLYRLRYPGCPVSEHRVSQITILQSAEQVGSSGNDFDFYSIRNSAGTILRLFMVFPQSLQAISGIVSHIRPRPLSNPLFVNRPISRSEILTESLNKQINT